MKYSHTQGPWSVEAKANGVCATIVDSRGHELAFLDCGNITTAQNVCNGWLMAMAPEMLIMLEQLQNDVYDLDTKKELNDLIKKAKGTL